MKDDYRDLIGRQPPVLRHKRMSLSERAAQFSPFAVLAGYEDELAEEARQTEEAPGLSSGQLEEMDRAMREAVRTGRETAFTLFVPDAKKAGGAYKVVRGKIRKMDEQARSIELEGGEKLAIDGIVDIDIGRDAADGGKT